MRSFYSASRRFRTRLAESKEERIANIFTNMDFTSKIWLYLNVVFVNGNPRSRRLGEAIVHVAVYLEVQDQLETIARPGLSDASFAGQGIILFVKLVVEGVASSVCDKGVAYKKPAKYAKSPLQRCL